MWGCSFCWRSGSRRSLGRLLRRIDLLFNSFAGEVLLVTQDFDDALILCYHRLDLRNILETELLEFLNILTTLVENKQVS